MTTVRASRVKRTKGEIVLSKDGYAFSPAEDYWRLNKDVQLCLSLPSVLTKVAERGFRATVQRYAEEMSARHAENMVTRFKRYLRDTGEDGVTAVALTNWRAMLRDTEQWQLGGLKGFLLAWHEYGFGGISEEVVSLLEGWRIRGNEKGRAVADGCPESGPFTDMEMAALLGWANKAVAEREIEFESYAYLLALAMTARRPVQIASLRGKDLIHHDEGGNQFRIRIPRAKQRGIGFRGEFRSLGKV